MKKEKSQKNKTIDFYIAKCIKFNENDNICKEEILNQIIIGDTFKLLKKIPSEIADLLVVDPPYNLSKDYHGNKFNKTSSEEYKKYTYDWLNDCKRIMKKNASIYVCCDWETSLIIGEVMCDLFHVQNRITWQREKGRGALSNWFATKSKDYTFNVNKVMSRRKVVAPYKIDGKPKDWEETTEGNFRNTYPSNFWDDISIPYWSMPENTEHPTQKPEKLIAKLILASSNDGEVVFDPFLGSGTTAVVAKKLNRQFIGIEQNPQYCGWAQYRLEKAETDKDIQGYVNGVFWERNTLSQQKKNKNIQGAETQCTIENLSKNL